MSEYENTVAELGRVSQALDRLLTKLELPEYAADPELRLAICQRVRHVREPLNQFLAAADRNLGEEGDPARTWAELTQGARTDGGVRDLEMALRNAVTLASARLDAALRPTY